MEIIRKHNRNKFFKTYQTVSYHDHDDGYNEFGIAHDYKVMSTGDQSGTTTIVINGKTHNLSNNCVRDNAVLRNGKPIVWARYVPVADIGPAADGQLFWKQWTLTDKTTISFDAASKEIRDSAAGFNVSALCDNRRFTIVGSTDNNETFNVNGTPTTSVIVVDETPTDEVAGATITLATVDDLIWNLRDQANANSLGGFTNWDIPNVRELFSALDFGIYAPLVDHTVFPSAPSSKYWSSTTKHTDTGTAFRLDLHAGILNVDQKTTVVRYCLLVRS